MRKAIKNLELLAPAKNLSVGIAAINAGADAVYIGGPFFGARASAGNSLEDIKKLIDFAHQFSVKVYLTLNTIVYNHELKEIESIINRAALIHIDGLIIQDMGILKMQLPSIPLIASTQCHNHELDKIKFLEEVGFKRVILARELTLDQIIKIRKATSLELEYFVHGSLCVSLSGRCYASDALGKRSANRGECLQVCRLPFSLVDGEGENLIKNKHLLSLKDLNHSENLAELIEAGITSFKIEGRLKDEDYVTNVVSYYDNKLNQIIGREKKLSRASQGYVEKKFSPDPAKTFNRGFTDYFLHGRHQDIVNINTPKSLGQLIGRIKKVGHGYFELDSSETVKNGDGLCFFDPSGELFGSNVNAVDKDKIYLHEMEDLRPGMKVYRNFNIEFDKILKRASVERKIFVDMNFLERENGFMIEINDDFGNIARKVFDIKQEIAKNSEQAESNIKKQLAKLGDTIFSLRKITISTKKPYFLPVSVLNEMRRETIAEFIKKRNPFITTENFSINKTAKYPDISLSFENNVSNDLAKEFYHECGVAKIEPAFELLDQTEKRGKKIMTTKHCLKYYLGACVKNTGTKKIIEPLYLVNQRGQRFRLGFDCAECFMEVYLD